MKPTLTNKTLGRMIATARKQQDLSVYRLSKLSKITVGQIVAIENGANTTNNTLFPVLKALKIKIEVSYNQKKLRR